MICVLLLQLLLFAQENHANRAAATKATVASESQTPGPDLDRTREQAEIAYYRAQADKINHPSTWDRVVSVSTLIAALAAALVTLISFTFNYRSTLYNQQDIQFYEALKRFGDKDSPALRAGAAGLLAEMGRRERLHLQFRTGSWVKASHPYLQTALDQMTTGSLLENNGVVLDAIHTAFAHLVKLDPKRLKLLYEQNLQFQRDLVSRLAEFLIAQGAKRDAISDELWDRSAAQCDYPSTVLKTLAERFSDPYEERLRGRASFDDLLQAAAIRLSVNPAIDDLKAGITESFRASALRLRSNVGAWSASLEAVPMTEELDFLFLAEAKLGIMTLNNLKLPHSQIQYATFYAKAAHARIGHSYLQGFTAVLNDMHEADLAYSHLENARLISVNFRGADLRESFWGGCTLDSCKLDGAKLHGVKMDEQTIVRGTNWWCADFSDPYASKVDEKLIAQFHDGVLALRSPYEVERYFPQGINLSNWLQQAHPTVKQYIDRRSAKTI
jgi:hypothetical protein